MAQSVLWLFLALALYWTFCLIWGVRSSQIATTAGDYFLAGRSLPAWVYALTVTVSSLAAWTFLEFPALVYRDGFPFAMTALCVITAPLTGVLFMRRQWILSTRHGYVTAGDMFAHYFRSDALRIIAALVALAITVPVLGIVLRASGYVASFVTAGTFDQTLAMWVLATPLLIYSALGGIRAVAFVGTLQCLLFVAGLLSLGLIAYLALGGFGALGSALADFEAPWGETFPATAEGDSSYHAVPGVIQFTAGLGREAPVGGAWTTAMILSYIVAMMGIQASPGFSTWAFACRSVRAFAPQQVWASAGVIGFMLLFFAIAPGAGAHFLGATPAFTDAGMALNSFLPPIGLGNYADVVPAFISQLGGNAPWFTALLALCGIAALQATGAAFGSTAATAVTRDLYLRYLGPEADDADQKRIARIALGLIALSSLLIATFSLPTLTLLGGLALGIGFQMLPALAAVCWFRWLTREGVLVGLGAGIAGVILTENLGGGIAAFLGFELPWGRWPWTLHSAVWGMAANVTLCTVVSAMSRRGRDESEFARQHHDFLQRMAGLSRARKRLRAAAWSFVIGWLFLGGGPGIMLARPILGASLVENGELLGIPALWVWLVAWWGLGVLMLWFLAYRMEMCRLPHEEVVPMTDDLAAAVARRPSAEQALTRLRICWSLALGLVLLVLLNWTFA